MQGRIFHMNFPGGPGCLQVARIRSQLHLGFEIYGDHTQESQDESSGKRVCLDASTVTAESVQVYDRDV